MKTESKPNSSLSFHLTNSIGQLEKKSISVMSKPLHATRILNPRIPGVGGPRTMSVLE